MTSLAKAQVLWTGFTGGPGVSTFYFDAATPNVAALRTFFEAIKAQIASTVTLKYPASGLQIDSITGQPIGSWSSTPPADTVCSGAGAYSAAVGAVVNWRTGFYTGGRELRGKTFIVPLSAQVFTATGSIGSAAQLAIQNAGAALVTSATTMRIWSKSQGVAAQASTVSVPSMGAVLTSRRD